MLGETDSMRFLDGSPLFGYEQIDLSVFAPARQGGSVLSSGRWCGISGLGEGTD